MTFRTLLDHLNSLAEYKPQALDEEFTAFVDLDNDEDKWVNLYLHKAALTKIDEGKSRLYFEFKIQDFQDIPILVRTENGDVLSTTKTIEKDFPSLSEQTRKNYEKSTQHGMQKNAAYSKEDPDTIAKHALDEMQNLLRAFDQYLASNAYYLVCKAITDELNRIQVPEEDASFEFSQEIVDELNEMFEKLNQYLKEHDDNQQNT